MQRPGDVRLEADLLAVQQGSADPGDRALGGPAQCVQPGQACGVGRRGDHRLGVERVGDPGAQHVGAGCVTADECHRVPARFVHADHGRVDPLAVQQWGNQPGGRAHRQEAHQPVALRPGAVQRLLGRPFVGPGLVGPCLGQPGGGGAAGHGDGDEPDHGGAPGPQPWDPVSPGPAGSVVTAVAQSRNTGLVAASRCTAPGSGASLAACTSAPSAA